MSGALADLPNLRVSLNASSWSLECELPLSQRIIIFLFTIAQRLFTSRPLPCFCQCGAMALSAHLPRESSGTGSAILCTLDPMFFTLYATQHGSLLHLTCWRFMTRSVNTCTTLSEDSWINLSHHILSPVCLEDCEEGSHNLLRSRWTDNQDIIKPRFNN